MTDGLGKCRPRSVPEYRELARRLIPEPRFEYFDFPESSGQTYIDSSEAFKRYRFRPRLLNDVSTRRLATTLLSQPVSIPIGTSPAGHHRQAHDEGEVATAKGAAATGALMIQSSFSNRPIAEVAAAAPGGVRWMQTYFFKDRRYTERNIRLAEAAGYGAVVVTIDSPSAVPWASEKLQKNASIVHYHEEFRYSNLELGTEDEEEYRQRTGDKYLIQYYVNQLDPGATWEDIKGLKSLTSLPIVCKGILTGLAARQAADAGASGIIVSAHGGRQLDGVPAPIDALSEVAEAVRGRDVEVYLDGGVRSGADVFKALALGAKAVFVGRPILWGLACDGARGAEHVLAILRDELDSVMSLCGCSDVNAIPRDVVVHESFYKIPRHKL